MSDADREKWDKKYSTRSGSSPGPPAAWLEEQLPNLPRGGRALDLAAGDGANSLLLASRGWKVTAVDISEAGLAIGRSVAGPLPVEWVVSDLDDYLPPSGVFDLVMCFRYLDRDRLPTLVDAALKPGGMLIAETFNRHNADPDGDHPKNPEYLLGIGEWLRLFDFLTPLQHDESGSTSKLLAAKS